MTVGPRWTSDQIAAGLLRNGFTGWQVVTMGAICQAESGGYIWAHGLNSHDPKSIAYLSEDHGLFQINDYWGGLMLSPELLAGKYFSQSFSQLAKDPEWNIAAAREVFLLAALQRGYAYAYTPWNSFNNGLHKPFLQAARLAAMRAGVLL